jgi:chitin-binding protein
MGGAKPDHTMTHEATLPERTGRQMILSVWTIADTVNAFYSCVGPIRLTPPPPLP